MSREPSERSERLSADAVLAEDPELEALLIEDDLPLQEVAEQTTYGEIVLEDLIRRQRALSLSVAAAFLLLLFGLPIFNLLFPGLGSLRVVGISVSWLVLAIAIYPVLWLLAYYYVTTARKYEHEFTEQLK